MRNSGSPIFLRAILKMTKIESAELRVLVLPFGISLAFLMGHSSF